MKCEYPSDPLVGWLEGYSHNSIMLDGLLEWVMNLKACSQQE